jgi:hypothetical protein
MALWNVSIAPCRVLAVCQKKAVFIQWFVEQIHYAEVNLPRINWHFLGVDKRSKAQPALSSILAPSLAMILEEALRQTRHTERHQTPAS